jgi:hypothetical protein
MSKIAHPPSIIQDGSTRERVVGERREEMRDGEKIGGETTPPKI